MYDVDTHLIHGGLVAAPRLRDTTRWFTGTWAGQVPFYRPLTSYVFWAQWQLWGKFEQRYNVVAIALHLLAVVALMRLTRELLGVYRIPFPDAGTFLTGLLFVYGLGILPWQAAITQETFSMWKNQPDSLTLFFFSLCFHAYLRRKWVPTESRRQAAAPAFWYLLLCLTKEAGIFLPLLLPLIEASAFRTPVTRRAALTRMLPLWVVLSLYLGLRTWFLQDAIGYRFGSNKSWPVRLGSNIAGGFSDAVAWGNIVTVAVTLVLCISVISFTCLSGRRLLPSLRSLRPVDLFRVGVTPLGACVIAAVAVAWQQRLVVGTFDVVSGASQMFLGPTLGEAAAGALWLLCAGRALWQRPNFGLTCYAWGLLTLGLTLFSPSVLHRYYLMNAGFAVLLAGGAMLWIAPSAERFYSRLCRWGTKNTAAPPA